MTDRPQHPSTPEERAERLSLETALDDFASSLYDGDAQQALRDLTEYRRLFEAYQDALERERDDNHALWQGALETWEAVAAENTQLREALSALYEWNKAHEHDHTGWAIAHGWRQSPAEAAEAQRIGDLVRAALAGTAAPRPQEEHPEASCQRCKRPNITWHTRSDLWNRIDCREAILCPVCFAEDAEKVGAPLGSWLLVPDPLLDPDVSLTLAHVARATAAPDARPRLVHVVMREHFTEEGDWSAVIGAFEDAARARAVAEADARRFTRLGPLQQWRRGGDGRAMVADLAVSRSDHRTQWTIFALPLNQDSRETLDDEVPQAAPDARPQPPNQPFWIVTDRDGEQRAVYWWKDLLEEVKEEVGHAVPGDRIAIKVTRMTQEQIDALPDDDGGWGVWDVRCTECGCEHTAVAPIDVDWPLECNGCREMACRPV